MYFSFKFNFGNDPTESALNKGSCSKRTNIGKNDIISFRLFVLAFFSLFADQFLTFCPFDLSKSFFEIRMWPLVHWLPEELIPCCWLLVVMFQRKEPPNHRKPND